MSKLPIGDGPAPFKCPKCQKYCSLVSYVKRRLLNQNVTLPGLATWKCWKCKKLIDTCNGEVT